MLSGSDLNVLEALFKEGSITAAATSLGLRQPSVSQALQRIEHDFGAPIFYRSKRGITPTPAGARLSGHVQRMKNEWENLKSKASGDMTKVQGHYTLGCHTSMALSIVSKAIPHLIEDNPALSIDLTHDGSRITTQHVIEGKLDIGFVVNPVPHPDLIIVPLYTGEVTFWRAKDSISKLCDTKDNEAVLITDRNLNRTRDLIMGAQKSGHHFTRMIHSPSLEVVANIVAHGGGVGILPINAARAAPAPLERLENVPEFKDDHCVIFRVERRGLAGIKAISNSLKQTAEKWDI